MFLLDLKVTIPNKTLCIALGRSLTTDGITKCDQNFLLQPCEKLYFLVRMFTGGSVNTAERSQLSVPQSPSCTRRWNL